MKSIGEITRMYSYRDIKLETSATLCVKSQEECQESNDIFVYCSQIRKIRPSLLEIDMKMTWIYRRIYMYYY